MKKNIKPKIKIWEKFDFSEKEWQLLPPNLQNKILTNQLDDKDKEQIRRLRSVLRVYLQKVEEVGESFLVD